MKKLSKTAAAGLLCFGLVAGAHAAKPDNEVKSNLDSIVAGAGQFAQVFEFETAVNYNPNAGSILVSAPGSLFSGLTIEIFSELGNDSLFGPISGGGNSGKAKATFADRSFSTDLLAGTTYQLRVSGVSSVPNASYAIQGVSVSRIEQISAVPEPANYAMLLAGLGMIGGIALRRSRRS
jgi:hypothetical protein